MTYFGILAIFLLPVLSLLLIIVPRDLWRWIMTRQGQVDWRPYLVISAHILMALVYTTPWDNYLVATNVWWYNPRMVTNLRIGYVPIEEYTFFIVQTLLTCLWTLALMRFLFHRTVRIVPLEPDPQRESEQIRRIRLRGWAVASIVVVWLISTGVLLAGWKPGTYLTLIISWGFFPIFIQILFGADILWAKRRLLGAAILPPTIYLWAVDALALSSGTWSIDPTQTTGFKLGVLPVEEMVFFFLTNTIIGFGVTLMLSPESQRRAQEWMSYLKSNNI